MHIFQKDTQIIFLDEDQLILKRMQVMNLSNFCSGSQMFCNGEEHPCTGVSILKVTQNLTGHGPGQVALTDSALNRKVT